MPAPKLPPEIIDMILDHFASCSRHPWANRKNPCLKWHDPPDLRSLTRLRLVSRSFNDRLAPILFHHVTTRGRQRHEILPMISRRRELIPFIQVLRIEVAPQDLGQRMRRVSASLTCTAIRKLHHYFEVLEIYLTPLLKRFTSVKLLHVTTTYTGIRTEGCNGRLPKGEVLPPCVAAICESVKKARMPELEELVIGVPYEGGYTTFFEDLDDHRYKRMLKGAGKKLKSASVRLYDFNNEITTIPFI